MQAFAHRRRHRTPERVGVLITALLISSLAGGTRVVHGQQPTFRAGTKLVVEAVRVTDGDGRPIRGLTASDFALTEDGEPQGLAFVEFQELAAPAGSGAQVAADSSVAAAAAATAPVPVTGTRADTTIAGSADGTIKYRDRRLMVLYFDLTALPPADLSRAYTAARSYIADQMTASDLIALMTFGGGGVRVAIDFTGDRGRLVEALQKIVFGEDADGDGIRDVSDDVGTAFGQDDAEFNILNTDRQLSALQTAASMLRSLPEQKSLVYFGSGLRLNGIDNQAQLRATTNAALRANVAMFPVDARGLVASAPLGNATQASPASAGAFTGQIAGAIITGAQRSQDTLYALAADTGGKALFDFNDLSLGIRQAAASMVSYYLLGYYSSHTALDGKFHRVKVSLRDGRTASVSYREGYFADKEFARFSSADKERQLEEALMLDNPVTDIPLAMEVNFFQLNRAEYFVPVSVKLPGSELALARRRGAQRTLIDLIGEVKDDYGVTIQNVRDRLDIKLTDQNAARLSSHPVQYDTGFTLLPGKYVLKILARDAETGRMGTYQGAFTIPNLNREVERLPISSVVLGSQRVPLGEAIYTVQKNDALAVNPLVRDGQKLLPSVTRVFSRGGNLHVYLQAYERTAATTEPLVAYASMYRDGTLVFQSDPVGIVDGLDARSKAVPIGFTVPLATLEPGRYDCQVTVLDPTGAKAAFWRAPIAIAP